VVAVLVALLLVPAAAAAGKPVITTSTFSETTPDLNFECGPYGYSFDVLATFTVTRRSIQFFDGEELVKEIRHVEFEGTLYKSTDMSKTVPYAGRFTRTFDAVRNTVSFSGLVRYSHPKGSGMVALGAGHELLDADTFEAIKKPRTFVGEYERAVCAYLAS